MLRFPYLPEAFVGAPPASWPAGSGASWRPLAPIRIIGPSGRSRRYRRALFDSGADDTVFPLDAASQVGAVLIVDAGYQVRWRGQSFALRFGRVELELADQSGEIWRWPAIVGFSPAPMRYPILGNAGCLCYFDALFRGEDRTVELQTTQSYPGTKT